MASGKIYTYPDNFRAFKALIAAQYSGADVKVAPNFEFGETNKSEEFLKKFPSGKVPAFESTDGKVLLTESNAIAYYVSDEKLRGGNAVTQARVWQWASWADSELLPAASAWVFPYLGIMPYNKQTVERARAELLSSLRLLESHLTEHTYLVTERVSLADVVVWATLLHAFRHVLEPAVRAELRAVTRWFTTLAHQPQVKSVAGEVQLCAATPQVDPSLFQKKKDNKKDKKPAQQPKKEAKKEEVKPSEDGDTNSDQAPVCNSSFIMDDFKRCYSNESEEVSIPYFWQKFDPENYSIWFAEYKYPEELSKVFMSCNLITGMFQRLDKMRKNAFSSVCLFGSDGDSTISGVWVWKGQDLMFLESPDWQIDYESYTWKKLDPAAAETKTLVQNYFSWTGTDSKGRKFNQGKIFK